jgi:very-short-patch-repair endonuclease
MSSKKQLLALAIAEAVGAGKPVALETVDFNDPDRPKTCLEVDFPILPVNQIAVIEGNAGKPIYQMSKWWARRRSSVFRSMLIAAATKAPDDTGHAAKLVWDNYYANHQKKGAFSQLKVADIFMGGGTTLVEGSRLGMQMFGNDLNPVAWFVVKQELAQVDLEEVKRLLADIEAEVKPQIMPFYYCDGPNGEKGVWTHLPTGRVEGEDFDPLALTSEQRKEYRYAGPEIIYTFWAKHGPCQVTGCGHRTPIMSSPVMAVKTLTVKVWPYTCGECGEAFDIEAKPVRMAPDVALFVTPEEPPFATLRDGLRVRCPHCQAEHKTRLSPKDGLVIEGQRGQTKLGKGKNKKVEMTLLVHPQWLAGSPGMSSPPPPQPSPAGGGSLACSVGEDGPSPRQGEANGPSPRWGEANDSSPQRGEVGRGATHWHPKPIPASLLQNARDLRKHLTDAEQLLWQCLRGKQLDGFKFRKQHPIERYVLDFYCPAVCLAIELDGGQHNSDADRLADAERTRWLNQRGIRVLRFWNHDVMENLRGVLEVIWDALHEVAVSPPPQPSPAGGGSLDGSASQRGEANGSSPHRGEARRGVPYGGSAQDDAESTARWNQERASKIRLLEVRGALPDSVTCPETGVSFKTGKEGGTAKPGYFSCGACGTVQKVVDAIRPTGKTAPFSAYALQAFSPSTNPAVMGYGGRFFAHFGEKYARQMSAATEEWEKLKNAELSNYWPCSAVPESLRATVKDVIDAGIDQDT